MEHPYLKLSPDGKTVTGYKKTVREVVIPDSVTTIGDCAFFDCRALQSIDIPDSVTKIGYCAFSGCSALQSIHIPDSVTDIGNSAFYDCSSLQSITVSPDNKYFSSEAGILYDKHKHTLIKYPERKQETLFVIPDSVTTIEPGAFRGCSALQSIDIPESVAIIEVYAFSYCCALQSIDIPDSVTTIGDGAFSDCRALQSIDIPDSVTEIGVNAFNDCSVLQSITVSPGNKNYCSEAGILYDKQKHTLIKYPEEKQESILVIPGSVTTIEERAFSFCSALQSIDIPDSVTTIGIWAFERCSALQSIDIPDSVTTIGCSAFWGCSALQSIDIPDSVTEIGVNAFGDCSTLQSIYIRIKTPEDISYINDRGFEENLDNPEQFIFDKSIFETCTLFVPPGTRWNYRHHPYFAQFKKIEIIH